MILIATGIWEAYVFHTHHYPEDIMLSVACFGGVGFLLALVFNGVTKWL